MKRIDAELVTPIYLQTERREGAQDRDPGSVADSSLPEDSALPEDPAAYVLGADGLYLCRNHRFFRSCVPARGGPRELGQRPPHLELKFPRIPRLQFELFVGFFDVLAERYGAEAAVLLYYDERAGELRFEIPQQTATVSKRVLGYRYPIDLKYEFPRDLPPHLSLIGDIHSHADEAAYASLTDKGDEVHQAGIHLVVGRLYREPPEIHCEFVVDGYRFTVPTTKVLQGYGRRRTDVPPAWYERIEVRTGSQTTAGKRVAGGGEEQHPKTGSYGGKEPGLMTGSHGRKEPGLKSGSRGGNGGSSPAPPKKGAGRDR